MNTKMCLMVVLTAGFALSGCATTGGSAMAPSAKPAVPGTKYAPKIESDDAYVAQVERIARRRGIAVHWVHTPDKRTVDVVNEE